MSVASQARRSGGRFSLVIDGKLPRAGVRLLSEAGRLQVNMYASFYGLTEKPFGLTPNPKYLFLSTHHNEAIAHLEFGLRERGGFILITGEVGTGKTTLARHFLSHLDARTLSAVILYPALSAPELLHSILTDLRIQHSKQATLKELVDSLHGFLLEARSRDQNVVLLIDEAQDLPPDVLEQIRLISNLETDTEKLVQIVLIGQSELLEILERRELRQLAQRVTTRYHLPALERHEIRDYVQHRLTVAGGAGKVVFTLAALNTLHRHSHGIPRLINLICDRALLAGYVQGTRTITTPMVLMAAREALGKRLTPMRWPRLVAVVLLAVSAVFMTYALWPELAAWPTSGKPAPTNADSPQRRSSQNVKLIADPLSKPGDTATLEPILIGMSREHSFREALRWVHATWGDEDLLTTTMRTHFEQVKRFDTPVILELFHPERSDTCFVALLRIDPPETAFVAAIADTPQRIALSELDRFWTRQAVFLWRDFDRLTSPAGRARLHSWTRLRLNQMGYTEVDLVEGVKRFQMDADLVPDGMIGNRTLLALYSLGGYSHPRLSGDTS